MKRRTLDQAVLGQRGWTKVTPKEAAYSENAWLQMYGKLGFNSRDCDMSEIAVRAFERQACSKSDPWQAGCPDESRIPVSGSQRHPALREKT